MIGQVHVEHDRARDELRCEEEAFFGLAGDDALEIALVREVEQDPREPRVVLDDEDDALSGVELVAIVVDDALERPHGRGGAGAVRRSCRATSGGAACGRVSATAT